jgi:UDP-N-acetylmuramate dehydrogenase
MTLPAILKLDHDISILSAFKTKAVARYFADLCEHGDIEHLREIYQFAQDEKLPIVMLGAGTNCLFAFDHYDGIIIRNRNTGWEAPWEQGDRTYARIYSGEMSHFVAQKLYDSYEISTLVPWIGLPGTFGGATIGNAGCFGVEMSDIFVSAEVLDLHTGEAKNI